MPASPNYKQQAYLLISLALAMPILLWPMLLQIGLSPALGENIEHHWIMAASSLLIAVVVADSVLAGAHSYPQILLHAVWIIAMLTATSLAHKIAAGNYLVALLFILHSLRATIPLWCNRAAWWHRMAWVRDLLIAAIILYWLIYWPAAW